MTEPRRKTNGHGANGGNGAALAAFVNQTISQHLSVTDEAKRLHAAVQQGRLSERAQLELFTGEDRAVLEAVNGMLDALIVPLTVTSTYIDHISKGNIPEKITDNYNGDFNTIKNNLNACIDGLGGLVEANKILQRMAVNDLTLSVQGAYNGIFAEVAAATNQIRDHLEHVVQIARHIAAGNYRVDLTELKKRGKRCDNDTLIPAYDAMMEAIDAMASDTEMLCQAALEGKLATRADASKHQGEYKRIVEGINGTLDAVVGPLKVSADYVNKISKGEIPAKITDNYNGDFNLIKNNLNTCIDAVSALVADATMLAKAAVEGKLATRADASKHGGDFRKIVEGVNDTLDSVVSPLKDVAATLDQLAGGDLTVQLTGEYAGDFKKLADAVINPAISM